MTLFSSKSSCALWTRKGECTVCAIIHNTMIYIYFHGKNIPFLPLRQKVDACFRLPSLRFSDGAEYLTGRPVHITFLKTLLLQDLENDCPEEGTKKWSELFVKKMTKDSDHL
ncbi:MAG TPA: hypothetical protein H9894_06680 [Candidatus Desulfovibrio intestinipullorum]|uniref:Uncharacterized protein n=1 Tax=Candidatus Desulfovibrio intestinipullorum TaxID=2838536 RepID=A0A9D1TPN2_9BACT|nr:hypothetical protein [Candidatus Desulfovibrio intestinipullorum]